MKKFFLLKLYPCQPKNGFIFNCSGNLVIDETEAETEEKAIKFFQDKHIDLVLNCNGYAKFADVSYCVAQSN